jgi:hypothetical protein
MFDIESVADKMVRIDDTYIPAVNIQIEGFPCVINGDHYDKYFEVLWECEDHTWEVSEVGPIVLLEVIGPMGTLMDEVKFTSWVEFKDYFKTCRKTLGGYFLEKHLL